MRRLPHSPLRVLRWTLCSCKVQQLYQENTQLGISTPTTAGNPGDIVFQARPTKGGNSGWIYTTDNDWYRFGYNQSLTA